MCSESARHPSSLPCIPAAALKHDSSKFILRTSTIIFTMKIMIEVLNILQLLHRDSNKAEPVSLCCTNKFSLMEPFSEKYLKKLIGKTDIEGALKRLGRLTPEEARMADAQLLKVTNTIDHGKLRITCLSSTIG